ncbi:MAG: hypothetical protein ABI091_31260, partial [Ferruginibacter sp.]
MSLPKVLIVGQPLDNTGGGITLSNLFAEWESDELAIVCTGQQLNNFHQPDQITYYQLGDEEFKWMFPLNLIQRKFPSGLLTKKSESDSTTIEYPSKYNKSFRKTLIDRILYPFLSYSGIFHLRAKTTLSSAFCQWLDNFKPEVLYVQFSGLDGMKFAGKLQSHLGLPMIIHIVDDWLSTVGQEGPLKQYWHQRIDKEFKKVISQASVLMSICEAMSEEYKLRYNREFIPFRNPINLQNWLPHSKKEWTNKSTFNILYTGRIGRANGKSIMLISKVISLLNQNGLKIRLDIYSPDHNTREGSLLTGNIGVSIKSPVPHTEMPSLLSTYDLLFLPLDFDKDGIHFAQFSMPTKTSEYMISGTPILVFADESTALVKYALKYKW